MGTEEGTKKKGIVYRTVIGHLGSEDAGLDIQIYTPLGKLVIQSTDEEITIHTHELGGYIQAWTTPVDDWGSVGRIVIRRGHG